MPGSNSGSGANSASSASSASSSNSSSSASTKKNKKAAKEAAKAAKEAAKRRLEERRANARSVRVNVTARFGRGKLGKETRAKVEEKLKKYRADPALGTAERKDKEKKLFKDVDRKLKELEAAEEAAKLAKEAEKAAKKEAAKSARTAATTARRQQKERDLAQAKANLKNFMGKSPLKKHIEGLYRARQNKTTAKMTAANYGKAHGLRNKTRKLTTSQEKVYKKYKTVMADFEAKDVDASEFCDMADKYRTYGEWLQEKHKEANLKHSIPTIINVCAKADDFAEKEDMTSSQKAALARRAAKLAASKAAAGEAASS